MKTSQPIQTLKNYLIQGDMDNAKRMLQRDDIRLRKCFLNVFEAALKSTNPDVAEWLWDMFDRKDHIAHLPTQMEAVRMAMAAQHGLMCEILYPQFRAYFSYVDQHNFAVDALVSMNANILGVCWREIDFQNGTYDWNTFFNHSDCANTIKTLTENENSHYLNGNLLVLANRFQRMDIVHDIFSHQSKFEVFQVALGEANADLLHVLLDQAGEAQEHFIVQSVQRIQSIRQLYITQEALNVFDSVVLGRQRARISKAVETPNPKRDMKRKM